METKTKYPRMVLTIRPSHNVGWHCLECDDRQEEFGGHRTTEEAVSEAEIHALYCADEWETKPDWQTPQGWD